MNDDESNTIFKQMVSDVESYEADLSVNELSIDPLVQRAYLNELRVEQIIRKFNPAALGRITVSERKDRSKRVIDGMHRLTVVRRITDNNGTIPSKVFKGLSLKQEADLFLALNAGEKPTIIDRYRVSLVGEDPETLEIDRILHAYGWTVSTYANSGNLNCVKAVQTLYRRSIKEEAEPNLLGAAIMIINRAWGDQHDGVQAPLITGIGRLVGEYGSDLDIDRVIQVLTDYEGGPRGLLMAAKQIATLKRRQVAMGVAELIVESYNVRLGGRRALRQWVRRS